MSMENPPVSDTPQQEQSGASKATTIVLFVSLVLVIIIAGVLGAVAVLMTRSPNAPLLGAAPPQQLASPIHFAPVRDIKDSCAGEEAVKDAQNLCYFIGKGVTVTAVQQIEVVSENDGTYSVRIAMAPAFKDRVASLVSELLSAQRPLAVVVTPSNLVVAAPTVSEAMDGDSLSLGPLTRLEAESLAGKLGAPAGTPSSDPANPLPSSSDPAATPPGQTGTGNPTGPANPAPGTTNPTATNPTATNPAGGASTPAGNPPVGAPTGGSLLPAKDKRYPSCKEAIAAGAGGPYTRGRHTEYGWYVDKDNNGVACNPGDL
ncbi:excalibur calcium-binding domain-containing protein [Nonomuraea typhae]|uniref:excalibur calcium-binding domain-containing protein n=1 Tax=Nonomuraea typhae TaxID=2603600 RepID=UPI0015E25338|nr:excalibur calcium-binding domain-containing protein [Nonomuraea typhae]